MITPTPEVADRTGAGTSRGPGELPAFVRYESGLSLVRAFDHAVTATFSGSRSLCRTGGELTRPGAGHSWLVMFGGRGEGGEQVTVMSPAASSALTWLTATSSTAACMRLKAVVISQCRGRSRRKVPARCRCSMSDCARRRIRSRTPRMRSAGAHPLRLAARSRRSRRDPRCAGYAGPRWAPAAEHVVDVAFHRGLAEHRPAGDLGLDSP